MNIHPLPRFKPYTIPNQSATNPMRLQMYGDNITVELEQDLWKVTENMKLIYLSCFVNIAHGQEQDWDVYGLAIKNNFVWTENIFIHAVLVVHKWGQSNKKCSPLGHYSSLSNKQWHFLSKILFS